MRKFSITFAICLVAVVIAAVPAFSQTLAAVQDRGLRCGVNASLPGFGALDSDSGQFSGFDVDFCVGLAAAVGGVDIEFIALTAGERFTALQTGQIDVLSRNTTLTLTRDSSEVGADFAPTTFYDGQGFIVRADEGIASINDLDGSTICVTSGTTTEGNLADAFREAGLDFTPAVFAETEAGFGTFDEGGCDAYTSDKSQLASLATTSANPGNLTILPDTISKEPLGPLSAHGDNEWADVIRWVTYALFFAEEKGITQANVGSFDSTNPEINRFLGSPDEADLGAKLGLGLSWSADVIAAIGNYAEVYERHLGSGGLNIPRAGSLNAGFKDGGLLYAPAWR